MDEERSIASSSPSCVTQRTCCLHENRSYNNKSNAQVQTDWAGVDLPVWNAIDFYQTEALEDEDLEEEQEMEYEVL